MNMKRFLLLNLFLLLATAATAQSVLANGANPSTSSDLNGDGAVSVQEMRLHQLGRR
jgi:hypothetical protein